MNSFENSAKSVKSEFENYQKNIKNFLSSAKIPQKSQEQNTSPQRNNFTAFNIKKNKKCPATPYLK